MIKSMTAFARSEGKYEFGALTWEVRSVNHRYLEASVKLPEDLRGMEQSVREEIAAQLKRGKVECLLRFKHLAGATSNIHINHDFIKSLVAACDQVNDLSKESAVLNPVDILRWPGAVDDAGVDFKPIQTAALSQLKETLQDLIATREREGEKTHEMIQQRIETIAEIVKRVRQRRPQVLAAIREKITTKLNDLSVTVDENRLEQELVVIAQKMDVDEELDRLDVHVAEVSKVLKRNEPVGRRLDFLMQEFNREANTLSSKSADSETTQAAVDLKVLIEQMREQVQNIE